MKLPFQLFRLVAVGVLASPFTDATKTSGKSGKALRSREGDKKDEARSGSTPECLIMYETRGDDPKGGLYTYDEVTGNVYFSGVSSSQSISSIFIIFSHNCLNYLDRNLCILETRV